MKVSNPVDEPLAKGLLHTKYPLGIEVMFHFWFSSRTAFLMASKDGKSEKALASS